MREDHAWRMSGIPRARQSAMHDRDFGEELAKMLERMRQLSCQLQEVRAQVASTALRIEDDTLQRTVAAGPESESLGSIQRSVPGGT
jgi:hypothetical protein